jgi:hypothetical protein
MHNRRGASAETSRSSQIPGKALKGVGGRGMIRRCARALVFTLFAFLPPPAAAQAVDTVKA